MELNREPIFRVSILQMRLSPNSHTLFVTECVFWQPGCSAQLEHQEWEEILTKRWKEQGFHLQRRKAGQILRAQTLAA